MEKYIKIISEYRILKDEVERIVNLWAKTENKVRLEKWNELKVTDISYGETDIIATVIDTDDENIYLTYYIPKDILFNNEKIKEWIKDRVYNKIIGNNKYCLEEIDDTEYEIEKLKKKIEDLHSSYIDIDRLNWDEVLNFA